MTQKEAISNALTDLPLGIIPDRIKKSKRYNYELKGSRQCVEAYLSERLNEDFEFDKKIAENHSQYISIEVNSKPSKKEAKHFEFAKNYYYIFQTSHQKFEIHQLKFYWNTV